MALEGSDITALGGRNLNVIKDINLRYLSNPVIKNVLLKVLRELTRFEYNFQVDPAVSLVIFRFVGVNWMLWRNINFLPEFVDK